MMTDRECFLATTNHEQPDRVLYGASFTPDLLQRVQACVGEGNDIGEHFGFARYQALTIRRPDDVPPVDYSRYWEGEDLPEGTIFTACGAARVPSGFYHFFGYVSPLRNATSLAEIENYPMDDVSQWDMSGLADDVARGRAEGRICRGSVGHMYETAWQIRGYQQFLMDTIERPAWAECLLERLAQRNLVKARAYAAAGADIVTCGDDVANQNALMFSPDWWLKQHHSRWCRVWEAVKSENPDTCIWYHSDGNVVSIVEHLVAGGVDILNPVQPECVDIAELHERFGSRLTFDGCIGTQSTMPFGTAADVRNTVRDLIENYARKGGLMLAPTHILEPEVPIANIQAFADACREYGPVR